jgi:hypothetical protein
MTVKTDQTKDIIIGMLKENTGTHFLDSGGAYGRNYERNQKRDFEKEPACEVDASFFYHNGERQEDVLFYYNVFHYLNNFLEYEPNLQKEFDEFEKLPENKDKNWLQLMQEFAESKNDEKYAVYSTNTYNYDNIISQVLQYTRFKIDGEDYILLQVHGGCDVRGGYTAPKIFRVSDLDYFLMAQTDIEAYVKLDSNENQAIFEGIEKPPTCFRWYSDDGGYHWYADDEGTPKLELHVNDNKEPYMEYGGKQYKVEFMVNESY